MTYGLHCYSEIITSVAENDFHLVFNSMKLHMHPSEITEYVLAEIVDQKQFDDCVRFLKVLLHNTSQC